MATARHYGETMGRGHSQSLPVASSALSAPRRRGSGRSWADLAASDVPAFAAEVAARYEAELTEALKAATPADRFEDERWFEQFETVKLSEPRSLPSSPIVLTLAAFNGRRSDELDHLDGAGYPVEAEALLAWVEAVEGGQTVVLEISRPHPAFVPFRAP